MILAASMARAPCTLVPRGGGARMSVGDLDELLAAYRTEEANVHTREAVACYRAGAYKACIVSMDCRGL
jgi:hypothetical protein